MDPALRASMLAYYDRRAAEYEEAYTRGTGTTSITDTDVFVDEAAALAKVVTGFGGGHLIDLACGTGYWLPYYASRCSRITLLDQSDQMLAECRQKVESLSIADRCALVRGDVIEHVFERGAYDCALIGFLLSHLSEEQEQGVFQSLRMMLRPGGQCLILESAWTDLRAEFNRKEEQQTRRLNDGTAFAIYKRYIGLEDIDRWRERYGLRTHVEYFGEALCAVSGRFEAD